MVLYQSEKFQEPLPTVIDVDGDERLSINNVTIEVIIINKNPQVHTYNLRIKYRKIKEGIWQVCKVDSRKTCKWSKEMFSKDEVCQYKQAHIDKDKRRCS